VRPGALDLARRLAPALARARHDLARGRPRTPYKLELFLTWRCASRCQTCSIWRRPAGVELDVETWRRVVASVGPRLLWLSLTGGECSLRDDLGELIVTAAGAAPSLLYINLSSNGLHPERLERHLSRALPRLRVPLTVTLSLDGLGARHDELRGVPGAHERVLESAARLERLRARHPGLAFAPQVTLSASNQDQWPALARHSRALSSGISPVFSPAVAGPVLAPPDPGVDLRRAGAAATQALLALLDQIPARHPEDVITRRFLSTLPAYLARGVAPLPCTAGYASLSVEPDGVARRCDSLDERLGQLEDVDWSVPALLRSPQVRAAFAGLPRCRRCWTPCQAYPTLMAHPSRLLCQA
jgi:MoaA/NifB/PqqE/SkfB family radical SAM enzyme